MSGGGLQSTAFGDVLPPNRTSKATQSDTDLYVACVRWRRPVGNGSRCRQGRIRYPSLISSAVPFGCAAALAGPLALLLQYLPSKLVGTE